MSLPGIATTYFDKIYENEMPVVIDDQEREVNIPVIDLEKEVFDLDSYNYNQTLVLVMWTLVFQALQLALPVFKI